MSSIYDWSTTASSNSSSDSAINWAEGMAASAVNNSARAEMGRVAEFVKDIGGTLTSAGTANAQTVTANSAFTTYANGRVLAFIAGSGLSNTGATTLNVNAIGAKAVRKMSKAGDVAIEANDIRAGGVYVVVYNTALNSAAGAWLLLHPTEDPVSKVTSTDNAIARFNGTSGAIQNSTVTVADNGTIITDGEIEWGSSTSTSRGKAALFTSSDTAITGLVGGVTTSGSIVYAPTSAHMVLAIRDNDSTDSVSIISGGGDYSGDSTFDKLVAQFLADGTVSFRGTATNIGYFSNTGATQGKIFSGNTRELASSVSSTDETAHQSFYNPNGKVGEITTGLSATKYTTSSDERMKEGFRAFDSGAILDAVTMYQFDWKAGGIGYGPKAQELHAVFPIAVATGSEGDQPGDETFRPWSWDASTLVPILIAEVQSLRKRMAALEAHG
jgi:hypothetical protein